MEARGNLMLGILANTLDEYFLMTSRNQNQPSNFIANKVTGIVSLPLYLAPNQPGEPSLRQSERPCSSIFAKFPLFSAAYSSSSLTPPCNPWKEGHSLTALALSTAL